MDPMPEAPRRAVVTGRGVFSPLGCDWPTFAAAARAGAPAPPASFPGSPPEEALLCHALGGEAQALAGEGGEPLSALATAAARQALLDAGIPLDQPPLDDVGLVMNTFFGPSTATELYLERLRSSGPRGARPTLFVDTLLSMPASRLGIALGLRGSTAVLGGSSAFELAFDWVRSGREQVVVAGGGEYLSPKCLRYYHALAQRSGAARARLAQGAAFLVIEEAAHAAARGATLVAELLGAGAASEPQEVAVPWSRDPEGCPLRVAMSSALAEAGVTAADVSLVALAAGDDASEQGELAALHAVFGERVERLALLCPKRLLGEALGASAALGLLAALAQLEGAANNPPLALVNLFEMGGAVTSVVVRPPP